MIHMKTNTNNNLMQYIMNTLMTKIELDADVLSVACMMEGPVRKEDVVPEMMTNADWFAAKNYALSEGWIAKDPTGPSNRGARYVANDPTPQQMEEVNVFEEMGLTAFDYAADQHLIMAKSLFQSNPGAPFNAWDLRRGRDGPCTNATWPYVRDNLLRDLEIELKGNRRARTYTHIPYLWQVEDRAMELESILSSVFDVLSGRLSEGVGA